MKAASFGRRKELPLRQDWDQVKVKVMREALTAKFGQHPELAAVLEATGNALIVEHTENDKYWGDGGDGSGENMLGRLLMEIREGLRSKNRSIPIEQIDPALAAEASRNPGGYVYVIDEEVSRSEHGPPEAIRGCYKVDNEGKITGEFIVNPNYRGAGNR